MLLNMVKDKKAEAARLRKEDAAKKKEAAEHKKDVRSPRFFISGVHMRAPDKMMLRCCSYSAKKKSPRG